MARAQSGGGLTIQFWRTGLYTNRSQLFAPMRSIGINVVQMKDALIDGSNMEVTDHFEIQRRPGFSRFCSEQLALTEIPQQFYSWRSSTGTVFPLMDSTTRFATFSTSAITTIWTKPSSDQAFPLMVGRQLYICNGTVNGQKRYDTGTATLHGIGIPAPTNPPTITPSTVSGPTFWQPNINYGPGTFFLLDSNGNIQYSQNAGPSITGSSKPLWGVAPGTLTLDGTMGWQNFGPPITWKPNTFFGIGSVTIIDSNGNLEYNTTGGTSGGTEPVWPTVIGNTVVDGGITWKMLGNATASVFSGYIYAYVYSTQASTVTTGYYHCSTASPAIDGLFPTYTTGVVFGPYSYVISGAFSTNTDCGSVDIYRTGDGGSTLNYLGSVINNTAGGTWTFTDNIADKNLKPSITIPVAGFHRNDPPPGSTGTSAPSTDKISHLSFWRGRLWAVAGNKVYFDAGPDCTNGDPHASWPPANVFTFPGQVICTTPTSAGLIVWLANSVKIILGGPATLSFYDDDLMDKFGISSPNCVDKDGDTIRVISTQGQQWTLTVSDKIEEGSFVADLIEGNFQPATSYITTHRQGRDSGVFLSDGATNVFRYGLNIQAWSPLATVGQIKALRSIETSIGKYTLCLGRSMGHGYILGRDLGTFQDDGANYTCSCTVGNIVLSEPLQPLQDVDWIAGYFGAQGSTPTCSILPNEIDGNSGIGFIPIPNPVGEIGIKQPTTFSLRRWSLSNQQTVAASNLFHHLQVRFDWPAENTASTLKVLALGREEQ